MNHIKLLVASIAFLLVATTSPGRANDPTPKPYPLITCLVCGMRLGSMGEPFVFVYLSRELKLRNPSERADFDKDPAKLMKKLAAAAAKQAKQ